MSDKQETTIRSREDLAVLQAIREQSNYDQATVTLARPVSFAELWFTCTHCGGLRAVEQMFFVEESADELLIQNFSTFFKPEDGFLGGLNDDFTLEGLRVVCGSCLRGLGVTLKDVPVVQLPGLEEHIV